MNQTIMLEQTIIPLSSISFNTVVQSHYANFQSNSSTKESNAMIDLLEDVVFVLDQTEGKTET